MPKTITVYSFNELSVEAQDRAIERERQNRAQDESPWIHEIHASYKAARDAFQVSRDAAGLSGPRAMAWLENNVYGALRLPWTGKARHELRRTMARAPFGPLRFWAGYEPGKIKPCPFTGVCFDEDFIKEVDEHVKRGGHLGDVAAILKDCRARLVEREQEDYLSRDQIADALCDDSRTFHEDGTHV